MPVTPTLSAALADTVTVPETVPPAAGAVTETDGGVPSSVVKVKSADIARLPAASCERTRKGYRRAPPRPLRAPTGEATRRAFNVEALASVAGSAYSTCVWPRWRVVQPL